MSATTLARPAPSPVLFIPAKQPARPMTRQLKVVSDYQPSGDQPTAIAELVAGVAPMNATRCCWASPGRARPSPWPR